MVRPSRIGAVGLVAVLSTAGCGAAAPASTPPISPGTPTFPREVNVIAKEWTFVPSTVDLVPGETVILHLVNGGTEAHEAVIGGPDTQAAWETAHASVAGAPPGPTPAVSVAPAVAGFRLFARSGERADGRWTVPAEGSSRPAPFVVGCHIPGHFQEGMVVPVRWIGGDGQPLEPAGSQSSSSSPSASG